ncbi:hypothetical protein [Deinococcus pimensis]|uniref:hypothetical protein n=1 Tax=Deinococcus pimensis TaxID=309888 RepID=UPI0004817F08|nr:hypothetical protein [Deinococcus pimensis]
MSKKRQKRQARRARRAPSTTPTLRGEFLSAREQARIAEELRQHVRDTLGYYPIEDEEAHYLWQLGLNRVTRR